MSNYFDSLLSSVGLANPAQLERPSVPATSAESALSHSDFSEISVESIAPSPAANLAPTLHTTAETSSLGPTPSPLKASAPNSAQPTSPAPVANTLPLPGELTQHPGSAAVLQHVLAWIGRDPEPAAPPVVSNNTTPATLVETSSTTTAPHTSPAPAATHTLQHTDKRSSPSTTAARILEALAPHPTPASAADTSPAIDSAPYVDSDEAAPASVTIADAPSTRATAQAATQLPLTPFIPSTRRAPDTSTPPVTTGESSLNVSIGSIYVKIEGPAPASTTVSHAPAPRTSRPAPAASSRTSRSNRLSRHAL